MKILVFGSLNIDRRYIVDHFVQPGETLSSLDVGTFSGGKGLNQAIACKKAGSDVYMAGKIGKDGAFLLAELKDADVSTKHVFIDENMMSGHAIIQVDTNGQNCIITYGGTNRAITKEEIDEVLADFSAGDIILMQNEINSMEYIIDQAHAKGMLVALNPSPIDDALMNSDLSKVTYFIMNEVEAAKISGKADVTEAFDVLRAKYPQSKIVITMGGDGSMFFVGEKIWRHGIYKVKAVDTTAAGDTFTGYFLNGLLEGLQPLEIMSQAAKASAIAVSQPGAADSIPTKDVVLATQLELK